MRREIKGDKVSMIQYDCHMHTSFSSDSKTPPEAQIERAIELGMRGICVTDHMDREFPNRERSGMDFEFDPKEYFRRMEELREKYRDRIELLIGIELGLRNEPECRERINSWYDRLLEDYPFDLTIGSTHCLEFTDPYYSSPYWDEKDAKTGIRVYLEAVLENITRFDGYDTVGHLDYLIRYIPEYRLVLPGREGTAGLNEIYDPEDYSDLIDEILKYLINNDKALEVNTAGLKYGLGYPHPQTKILKRYRELGGEMITIGSDGHRPEHICYGFGETREMLIDAGFKYQCVFKGRRPVMVEM